MFIEAKSKTFASLVQWKNVYCILEANRPEKKNSQLVDYVYLKIRLSVCKALFRRGILDYRIEFPKSNEFSCTLWICHLSDDDF